MPGFSVIILAKNEEDLIARAVASVAFADQVLVVDSGSSDRTIELAKAAGASVMEQEWLGWTAQRQAGISAADHDWVFILEADEFPDATLTAALRRFQLEDVPESKAFSVDRRGDFFGIELPNEQRRSMIEGFVRLFHRDAYSYDADALVHERVEVPLQHRSLLPGVLHHWRGADSHDYVEMLDRYADIEAADVRHRGGGFSAKRGTLRPLARIVWLLLVKREILLGWRGVLHALQSAYRDSLREARLWEAEHRHDGPVMPPRDDLVVTMVGDSPSAVNAGGLNRYFDELADALDAAEGVVARRVYAETLAELEAPMPLRLLRLTGRLLKTVRSSDVIDAHFALNLFLATFLPIWRARRLIVHFHGPWADEAAAAGASNRTLLRLRRRIERRVYLRADIVITLSDAFRDLVVDRYGVPSERVRVVPPGVDLEHFTPAAGGATANSSAPLRLVVVRRLVPRMGIAELIRAVAEARSQTDRPITLSVAGDGPQRAELEQMGDAAGVEFLGRVSDHELADLYRNASCSVVPTLELEGFGLIVLESLASGTPALVTRTGGLPGIIEQIDPSLVVTPGSVTELADRIVAAANGDLPSRQRCRSVAERYSWASTARAHIAVMHELQAGTRALTRGV